MAMLLKGAPVAASIDHKTKELCKELAKVSITPTLAIVRIGERADDISYEKSAMKRCEKVGVQVKKLVLSNEITQSELIAHIQTLNQDSAISGVLLFRPLPRHLDETLVCETLSPAKDIDGITAASMAGVFMGTKIGFAPCTAQACIEILDYYDVELTGLKTVIVGRSLVVGKPLAMLLLARHATVTVCHTRTNDLPMVCKEAKLLCVAAGRAKLIGADCIGDDAIVLDVGIHVDEAGNLCGDVDFHASQEYAKAITPVPGGVGTVTTSLLIHNVAQAAWRRVE
jgi:methylenetetrahydrofolate dehydrogenase (NADP+)/methenyltetrahydrofolate cyclohydrolase